MYPTKLAFTYHRGEAVFKASATGLASNFPAENGVDRVEEA